MLPTLPRIGAALLGATAASLLCLSLASAQDRVALAYKITPETPQSYTITLEQALDVHLGDQTHKIHTSLAGQMALATQSAASKGVSSIDVEFTKVLATLKAGDKILDGGDEFAREGALRMNLSIASDGAQSAAVMEKVSPQSDRMLRLLRDGFVRNLPEFPKEAIGPGHSWTRTSESKEPFDGGGEVVSKSVRTFALVGLEKGRARISIELRTEVITRLDDEKQARTSVIEGKGELIFDVASGQIQSQRLDLTLKSTDGHSKPSQTGTLTLGLERRE